MQFVYSQLEIVIWNNSFTGCGTISNRLLYIDVCSSEGRRWMGEKRKHYKNHLVSQTGCVGGSQFYDYFMIFMVNLKFFVV